MAKILITDDAMFMRTILKNILIDMGHTIFEASDGQQAVDLYKKLRPDLTTLDITMPVKDGMQALHEILAYDPGAKIIMVSAMGQKPFVLEAVKTGAKDFLVKPFDRTRIQQAITSVLE